LQIKGIVGSLDQPEFPPGVIRQISFVLEFLIKG
jgi:hypothetical protein